MPPAGAQPQPGSMSGLPLQVGDLPPGTVAVRVVRQPFTNVVGQQVELRIGAEGRPRTASTGTDGRAQFGGLAVGEHVMAVAIVDGERLESQLFQLPPRGGVRVLLLAGQGAGAPPAAAGSSAIAAPVQPVPEAGFVEDRDCARPAVRDDRPGRLVVGAPWPACRRDRRREAADG